MVQLLQLLHLLQNLVGLFPGCQGLCEESLYICWCSSSGSCLLLALHLSEKTFRSLQFLADQLLQPVDGRCRRRRRRPRFGVGMHQDQVHRGAAALHGCCQMFFTRSLPRGLSGETLGFPRSLCSHRGGNAIAFQPGTIRAEAGWRSPHAGPEGVATLLVLDQIQG